MAPFATHRGNTNLGKSLTTLANVAENKSMTV
jgi:hypothetical protein